MKAALKRQSPLQKNLANRKTPYFLRKYLSALSFLFFVILTSTCATFPTEELTQVEIPEVIQTPEKSPIRGPNEIFTETWQLPSLPTSVPSFPYLPNEDRQISRSIGNITFGYLVSARAIQYPHPTLSMLNAHVGRNLIYTTDGMVKLIESASQYVQKKYPEAITYVGNFSAVGGGDIPYSVSHNSGRDADLAFFMTDEVGHSVEPPNLLQMDETGKHVTQSGKTYLFDTPRNWQLIEGLIEHGKGKLQLIFISAPLKKMLLAHAKTRGTKASIRKLAASLLVVPKSALPHDDHFHIRIFCSSTDIASGCTNGGRRGNGFQAYRDIRKATIEKALAALGHNDATIRTMGIRRLGLLGARDTLPEIENALEDPAPIVRAAASRTLSTFRRGYKSLRNHLRTEEDPHTIAEIIWALSTQHSKSNARAISSFLKTPRLGKFEAFGSFDLRNLAIDALVNFESKLPVAELIQRVASEDPEIAKRAHRALTFLTNIDPTLPVQKIKKRKTKTITTLGRKKIRKSKKRKKRRKRSRKKRTRKKKKAPKTIKLNAPDGTRLSKAEIWKAWWKINKKKKRSTWIVDGFRASGFDISKLDIKNVWKLSRAIKGTDFVSYNAQRTLMRMTGRRVDSLSWSKADASFNWRRWVERRILRLRAPDIPADLTTLKPKSK